MLNYADPSHCPNTISIDVIAADRYDSWVKSLSPFQQQWQLTTGFGAQKPRLDLPDPETGQLAKICLYLESADQIWRLGDIARHSPEGDYQLNTQYGDFDLNLAYLAWSLGYYSFDRYKSTQKPRSRLWIQDETQHQQLTHLIYATTLVRDLINTPAEDMGPQQLVEVMLDLADTFGGETEVIQGERLEKMFPAVHIVGRASHREPRLCRLSWGRPEHPHIAIVGKGVCYDTGGLSLKPTRGMKLMKKDMGGAAHAIALAYLIMANELPIRITCVVPAVDNAVSGNAYRPGDISRTRKGLTVAVGDTDCEGRMILADALTYACEQQPELLIDFATLTGAARVALGSELPGLFCANSTIARDIQHLSEQKHDPIWPMPLYQPYDRLLKDTIADITNAPGGGYGGAITAALFLKRFVDEDVPWVHIDQMAYNLTSRPGHPEGGEAQGLRAMFAWLQATYFKTRN